MLHRLREHRERHADVGREPALPWSQRGDGERGVVPRLPEPRARLGRGLGLELDHVLPAEAPRAPTRSRRLPVELDEEARRLRVRGLLVGVDGAQRLLVEQLAARDGEPGADERDRGAARGADVRERGADRDGPLGQPVQAQRQLRDHAERSLRADEERAEVVAGRRLHGARAGTDDRAVREHDLEREHVRAHAAVANRRRPARVRRGHPAERRVGARVDREPETVLGDRRVQLAAQDAGLHARLQVAGPNLDHAVQAREVERDAAAHGDHVSLERRAGAERDDRDARARSPTRARVRPRRSSPAARPRRARGAGGS